MMRARSKLVIALLVSFAASTGQAAVNYDFSGICDSAQGCSAPVAATGVLTLVDGYSDPLDVADIESFIYRLDGVATFTFVRPAEGSGQVPIVSAHGVLPALTGTAEITINGINSPFQTGLSDPVLYGYARWCNVQCASSPVSR